MVVNCPINSIVIFRSYVNVYQTESHLTKSCFATMKRWSRFLILLICIFWSISYIGHARRQMPAITRNHPDHPFHAFFPSIITASTRAKSKSDMSNTSIMLEVTCFSFHPSTNTRSWS